MSGKIAHKKLWGKLVIDKQKSLGKPRLFAYNICPLQTIFCVSYRFISFQNVVKTTFLFHGILLHFLFHGTNTEQIKKPIPIEIGF